MCNDSLVSKTFDFSQALLALKAGARLARSGWNAKNQWVAAQFPDENSKMQCPYLYLKNAQDKLVPWVPSIGDIFATDWVEVSALDVDWANTVLSVVKPDGTNSSYHPKTKLEYQFLSSLSQKERWNVLSEWREKTSFDKYIRENLAE